jgi:hypothetical protein
MEYNQIKKIVKMLHFIFFFLLSFSQMSCSVCCVCRSPLSSCLPHRKEAISVLLRFWLQLREHERCDLWRALEKKEILAKLRTKKARHLCCDCRHVASSFLKEVGAAYRFLSILEERYHSPGVTNHSYCQSTCFLFNDVPLMLHPNGKFMINCGEGGSADTLLRLFLQREKALKDRSRSILTQNVCVDCEARRTVELFVFSEFEVILTERMEHGIQVSFSSVIAESSEKEDLVSQLSDENIVEFISDEEKKKKKRKKMKKKQKKKRKINLDQRESSVTEVSHNNNDELDVSSEIEESEDPKMKNDEEKENEKEIKNEKVISPTNRIPIHFLNQNYITHENDDGWILVKQKRPHKEYTHSHSRSSKNVIRKHAIPHSSSCSRVPSHTSHHQHHSSPCMQNLALIQSMMTNCHDSSSNSPTFSTKPHIVHDVISPPSDPPFSFFSNDEIPLHSEQEEKNYEELVHVDAFEAASVLCKLIQSTSNLDELTIFSNLVHSIEQKITQKRNELQRTSNSCPCSEIFFLSSIFPYL